jgi:hypothetical protein
MSYEPERDSRPPIQPLTMEINDWWRACAAAVGLAALGLGGLAVFVTHVEAGPVALLAVGLILLIVGAGGRLPSRLKVGENEAAWEAAIEDFATRVVDEVPSEQAPQLAAALSELAEAVPSAAAAERLGALTGRVAYEQMVAEILTEAVQELNRSTGDKQTRLDLLLGDQIETGVRLDAVVAGPGDEYLAVELKNLTHKVIMTEVISAVRQAVSLIRKLQGPEQDEESQVVRLLIISNQELHGPWIPGSLDRFFPPAKIYFQHVRVISKADLPEVIRAIRAAFEIPAGGGSVRGLEDV